MAGCCKQSSEPLKFHKMQRISLANQGTVSFSKGFCTMGLGVGSLVKIGFSILRSDNLIQVQVEIK